MNTFFHKYKQDRADAIIRAISKHIDETVAQYLPCSMSDDTVKAVSIYCNDYDIRDKEGDGTSRKIGDV